MVSLRRAKLYIEKVDIFSMEANNVYCIKRHLKPNDFFDCQF